MTEARRRRAWILAAALLLAAAFTGLASEMREAETAGLDNWALQQAHQWRATHPALEAVLRDITGLGSTVVLTLFTVTAAGYLWVQGHAARAALVGVAMASGALAVAGLKHGFGRMRPDPSLAAFVQDGLSFPSGHASLSAVFFLTVGALLAQQHRSWRVRGFIAGAALLLAGLVGGSRVLLGVHWASDVLGGWLFGAGWAALWLGVAMPLDDTASQR